MFFIFSKILAFVSNPLALIFVCLIASFFVSNAKLKKQLSWVTVILFFFFGNIFIIKKVRQIWDIPIVPITYLNTYQYGIVLGGGSRIILSDTNRISFNQSGDRLVQAAQLYRLGKIKKIIFTGGDGSMREVKHPEAHNVIKFFRVVGIPDSCIILEDQSRNTYENAIFTAEAAKQLGLNIQNSLLITNAVHMRRSIACFHKAGIACEPFSIDDVNEYDTYSFLYYFIPDHEMFANWNTLLHETLGYIAYKFKGYI